MLKPKIVYGRDQDPHTPGDLSKLALGLRKAAWTSLSKLGSRFILNKVFSQTIGYLDSKTYPGVEGFVAFSIDDSFNGSGDPAKAMTNELIDLFDNYDAKCTLFTAADCLTESDYEAVKTLVDAGHELANHLREDRRYDLDKAEDFQAHYHYTEDLINQFNPNPNPWFRPPHAKMNKAMYSYLESQGKKVIMTDCFANDTAIPDPLYISNFILKRAQSGSIALIHMPERGFREWNFEAMERTLKGLKEKGFKVVTVSELFERADL